MAEHVALIRWQRGNQTFTDSNFSRAHSWEFDGGSIIPASASPHIVPLPLSVAENVDPEEAYVAAISSCHMLTFLGIAAKRRIVVDEYVDRAVGILASNENGRLAVTEVVLRPQIKFSGGSEPTAGQLETLHHRAHELCFIANSVTTKIRTEIAT